MRFGTSVCAAVLLCVSCGGGGDQPTSPSPPGPSPPPPTSVTGTVAAGGVNAHELAAIETPGGLAVELTWQDAAVDLDLYLTDASCAAYPPASCSILAESSSTNVNVERLNYAVRRGDRLKLWVDNFDLQRSQSYRLQSVILASAGAGGSSAIIAGPPTSTSPQSLRRGKARR